VGVGVGWWGFGFGLGGWGGVGWVVCGEGVFGDVGVVDACLRGFWAVVGCVVLGVGSRSFVRVGVGGWWGVGDRAGRSPGVLGFGVGFGVG